MRSRTKIIIAIVLIFAILANAFAYISVINGSSAMLKLMKKVNLAYAAPKAYFSLADKLKKKPETVSNKTKELADSITDKSLDFIEAAFAKDDARIERLLDPSAKYIRSKDGSSFIRYVENQVLVEGYMDTDKRLLKAKQRWYIHEDDNTITCCVEVNVEGSKNPETFYIHFRKVKEDWKIYMLENNI